MSHLVVWRDKEGSALQTYAAIGDKRPQEFSSDDAHTAAFVEADELRNLVSSRRPFDKVLVEPEVARTVLGWDV